MKKLIGLFALVNLSLGILYGVSEGPFVGREGDVVSTRELVSSGGDDWFGITVGLTSFLISMLASVMGRLRPATLVAVYTINFIVYSIFFFLASTETPLWVSVALGDRPLVLALVLPPGFLMAVWLVFLTGGRRGNLTSCTRAARFRRNWH